MNLKELVKEAYSNGKSISNIAKIYNISQDQVGKIIRTTIEEQANETIIVKKYIRIQCIQERPNWAATIHKGEVVYADINSLYISSGGDVSMEVYNAFGRYMGRCNMKRFKSIV